MKTKSHSLFKVIAAFVFVGAFFVSTSQVQAITVSKTLNFYDSAGSALPASQTFTITNSTPNAGSSYCWHWYIGSYSGSPIWLSAKDSFGNTVTQAGGTGADCHTGSSTPLAAKQSMTVTVNITTSSLAAGSYSAEIDVDGTSTTDGLTALTAPQAVAINYYLDACSLSSFSASPSSMYTDQTSSVSWSTSGCSNLKVTDNSGTAVVNEPANGAVQDSGSITAGTFSAGSYTYTLTVSGGYSGSPVHTATTTITVNTIPVDNCTVSLSGASILRTQSTTLSWTQSGCDSLWVKDSGGTTVWSTTSPGASGTTSTFGPFNSNGTYTYYLYGQKNVYESTVHSSSANVVVSYPADNCSVALTGGSVYTSTSFNLSWSQSNCDATLYINNSSGGRVWTGTKPYPASGTAGVGPFSTPGTYSFTLYGQSSSDGSGLHSVSANVVVSYPPDNCSITSFSASPTSIALGQSTSLAWNIKSACDSTLKISDNSGTVIYSVSGASIQTNSSYSTTPGSGGVLTYTLTAKASSDGASSHTATATVTVDPCSIGSFYPTSVLINTGQGDTLNWTLSGCDSSLIVHDNTSNTDIVSKTGAQIVSPDSKALSAFNNGGNYTYTLTAKSSVTGTSSHTATTTINVDPCAISSFANPPAVHTGTDKATLSWVVTSGCNSSLTITDITSTPNKTVVNQNSPNVQSSGSTQVGPYSSGGYYKYTLTVQSSVANTPSHSQTATVTADPCIITLNSFTANPSVVKPGESTSLAWVQSGCNKSLVITNYNNQTIYTSSSPATDNGPVTTPALPTATGNYTFTLTAQSTVVGLNNTATVSVGVDACTITSFPDPKPISTGSSATLTWAQTGCDKSLTITNDASGQVLVNQSSPNVAASGSYALGTFNTAGTYTYTLRAQSSVTGSTVQSQQATITVDGCKINSFAPGSATITIGNTDSLSWSQSGCDLQLYITDNSANTIYTAPTPISSTGNLNLAAFNATGSYTYTLFAKSSVAGAAEQVVSTRITVNVPTDPCTISAFTVTPTSVNVGQIPSATLNWTQSGCDKQLSIYDNGLSIVTQTSPNVNGSGSYSFGVFSQAKIHTYLLAAKSSVYGAAMHYYFPTPTLTVGPNPPTDSCAITSMSPNGNTTVGSNYTVSWVVTGGCTKQTLTDNDGYTILNEQPVSSSSKQVGPFTQPGAYTYLLAANGSSGTVHYQAMTITVTDPANTCQIISFTSSSTNINVGDSITLSWQVSAGCNGYLKITDNQGNIIVNQTGGAIQTTGSITVGPFTQSGTYSYTLSTASSAAGAAAQVSSPPGTHITVSNPPAQDTCIINSFETKPAVIVRGNVSGLYWTLTGCDQSLVITDNFGTVLYTQNKPFSNIGSFNLGTFNQTGTFVYNIAVKSSVTGATTHTGSAFVQVVNGNTSLCTIVVTSTGNSAGYTYELTGPATFNSAGNFTFQNKGPGFWTLTYTGGASSTPTIAPNATQQCNGGQTITFTLNFPGAGCVINSFTANPTNPQSGDTITLSWNTSNCGLITITDNHGNTIISNGPGIGSKTYVITQDTTFTMTTGDGSSSHTNSTLTVLISSAQPTNLVAQNTSINTSVSCGQIQISWTGVAKATSYNLYRSTDSSSSGSVWQTTNATSYTDTTPVPGTIYYYWVQAVTGSSSSAVSGPTNGIMASPCQVNLSTSSKNIIAVNSQPYSYDSGCIGSVNTGKTMIIKKGDRLTMEVAVCNTGTVDAQNVVAKDDLTSTNLANLRNVSGAPVTINGNVATFTLGTIKAGNKKTFTFDVDVTPPAGNTQSLLRLNNAAKVTYTSGINPPGNTGCVGTSATDATPCTLSTGYVVFYNGLKAPVIREVNP